MEDESIDYYEVLQVSPNAEQETIHRVFRLLAQRFHPDNKESGDQNRFREIQEAYETLTDPERRARYDVAYEQRRHSRWRHIAAGAQAENDFEIEQLVRLRLLEALYTKRRVEAMSPTIYANDLEALLGQPREHLEFTIWYLLQRKYLTRDDKSRLQTTVEGVDYLEENYRGILQHKRLQAGSQ